jgi:hypothetical protein
MIIVYYRFHDYDKLSNFDGSSAADKVSEMSVPEHNKFSDIIYYIIKESVYYHKMGSLMFESQ